MHPHYVVDRSLTHCITYLSSHHNVQMAAIIHAAGHRLAFRAPYYPIDGPIEYVFNTIQNRLNDFCIQLQVIILCQILNYKSDLGELLPKFFVL